jgi:hypothetical protein
MVLGWLEKMRSLLWKKKGGRGEICEVYIVEKSNLYLIFFCSPHSLRNSLGLTACAIHTGRANTE